jgi:hypothetical protein
MFRRYFAAVKLNNSIAWRSTKWRAGTVCSYSRLMMRLTAGACQIVSLCVPVHRAEADHALDLGLEKG